jgi:calcineurin-like phosphoesterase family protein
MKINNQPDIFVISDLHFRHKNILKHSSRPYPNLIEMEKDLIKKWNKVIKPNDIIIVTGDFGFMGVMTGKIILKQLNGYKILILGNHDESRNKMLRMGFNEVYDCIRFKYEGINFVFSHYPYKKSLWNRIKMFFKRQRYNQVNKRLVPNKALDEWLIHGHDHIHGPTVNWELKSFNVACERWNYTPVKLKTIVKMIRKYLNEKNR